MKIMNIYMLDFYLNQIIQMIYVCLVVLKKIKANSDNKKKNYYEKCIGEKKADSKIEKVAVTDIGDKIYILQETNKFKKVDLYF
jgi:hypothetical protein